ncbi:hypothetical protein [Natronobacterium texcoconense]|nr:hypothetical protein [Natronobacterium texcoconense]
MFGDATPTGAFSEVQAVLMGVVVLSIAVTIGLYSLGLPVGPVGVTFLLVFFGTMVLAWPLFEKARPTHAHSDRD